MLSSFIYFFSAQFSKLRCVLNVNLVIDYSSYQNKPTKCLDIICLGSTGRAPQKSHIRGIANNTRDPHPPHLIPPCINDSIYFGFMNNLVSLECENVPKLSFKDSLIASLRNYIHLESQDLHTKIQLFLEVFP